MTKADKPAASKVISFAPFRRGPVAEEFPVGFDIATDPEPPPPPPTGLDLSGQPTVLFVSGSGNIGKTMWLRWVVERALTMGRESPFLAALDPASRQLSAYVEGAHQPPSRDPAQVATWLQSFLTEMMRQRAPAVIDFGGGDTSLASVIAKTPGFVQMMEDAGVVPVAIYLLSDRISDLDVLASFEKAGFRPRATALVLNEGRADPLMPRDVAFERTMQHSVFRAAVSRGCVPVWMPRLEPAKEVEARRISFAQARDAISPPGRKVEPLGPFERLYVREWLARMESEFAPVASWLP